MKNMLRLAAVTVPIIVAIFFDILIAIIVLVLVPSILLITKNITKRDFLLTVLAFFIFVQSYYLYFSPALLLAKNQGTVLSDNWFEALTWMNKNTPECAVVATYWDPGHFITGIARRAVVFDGASQGDLYVRPFNYTQEGIFVDKYDSNINHIVLYSGGNKTTARIQDISTTLLTANETLAIEILKEYRKPGCDDMYYIASSDLIGKSTWWTYFATWNPVDKKGTPYVYFSIPLTSARPDIRQNAIVYTYALSQGESFVLYESNSTPVVFLQQRGVPEPLKVARFIHFTDDGVGRIYSQIDAKVDGLVWIEPSKSSILFMQTQLENALFTRMFLYNGQGLEHFEFVNNWGGEVKLYKVKFGD